VQNKIIPILILIIIFFSSCSENISSNDVPPDQILRSYYAICVNGGTTYIKAEFFTEAGLTIAPFKEPYGKNVTLNAPSKVSFNGKEMEADKGIFGDICYKTSTDKWPANFRWDWIDKNGKKYSDSAIMDTIKLGNNYLVSEGNDYAVTWTGSSIRHGEEIAVTIKGDDNEYYDTSNKLGDKSIKITGSGVGIDPSGFYKTDISRTLMIRKVKDISVEHVAGSCIKLVYQYNE